MLHIAAAPGDVEVSLPFEVKLESKKLRATQAIISALDQQQVHGPPKAQREYGAANRASLDAERSREGLDERDKANVGSQHPRFVTKCQAALNGCATASR